ncbi:MAG: hypothetical protein DWI29_00830 [Planctomycetota bacterium]|nr:MAG: hypothetical protein DWI29_00830 [Planctomycetota bacterium]
MQSSSRFGKSYLMSGALYDESCRMIYRKSQRTAAGRSKPSLISTCGSQDAPDHTLHSLEKRD